MSRTSRKLEHVEYALKTGQSGEHGLSDVRFVHNCIPETATKAVRLDTTIGEFEMNSPIIINAMTGGAEETAKLNEQFALLAAETGLTMAVGSQMSAVKNPEWTHTYRIAREANPDGLIFANIGSEASVEQAQRAVDMLEADGLQIHLNVMQELIMPEGDRDFHGMVERIRMIREKVGVPVIVKEVGFGMSQEAMRTLAQNGIEYLDIGGSGGTNFARIENERRESTLDFLNDWGISTSASLLEASGLKGRVHVFATGGIGNALEIAKSLALGASAVGMAGFFLKLIHSGLSLNEQVKAVRRLHEDLILIMTALGISSVKDFHRVPIVIGGETAHWASRRGIDIDRYARRT